MSEQEPVSDVSPGGEYAGGDRAGGDRLTLVSSDSPTSARRRRWWRTPRFAISVLQVVICAVWLAVALEESRWFLVVCAAVALPIWVWHTIDVARADRRAALHREPAERPPG